MRDSNVELGYPLAVTIICPTCGLRQWAEVRFMAGDAFPTYWHICDSCGYEIGESEWIEETL